MEKCKIANTFAKLQIDEKAVNNSGINMAKGKKRKDTGFIYAFSEEKLKEFKDTSIRARLQWLEDANMFINKALGFKKRAVFDKRFKGIEKK